MSFASLAFIPFFFVVFAILTLTNLPAFARKVEGVKAFRRWFLLLASGYFGCCVDWRFALVLLGVILVAYFSALNIQQGKRARLSLCCGIVLPLLALAYFKYCNFFLGSLDDLIRLCGGENLFNTSTLKIIQPLGISFYSFQAISYVVDVHRGKTPASTSFSKVALYLAFFPRFVAGPIVRANYFFPQLEENRNVGLKNLEIGLQIFLIGLFKKIVVADRLAPFVDSIYATPVCFHGFTVALAVFSYALQIYFDFAGYSDMAIGVAKTLGYDLPRNFNFPYLSRNPSEFWKRWHISLSSWLMDYLYIPLGGNRKGKARTYLNLFTTMILGGLWHGASWAFVAWGGFHGAALCVHKFTKETLKRFQSKENAVQDQAAKPGVLKTCARFVGWSLSVLGTFVWVACCWIPFRADSFAHAKTIFLQMFVWDDGVFFVSVWSLIYGGLLLIVSIVALVLWKLRLRKARETATPEELAKMLKGGVELDYPIMNLNKLSSLTILMIFVYLILCFAHFGYNPFVYVQF